MIAFIPIQIKLLKHNETLSQMSAGMVKVARAVSGSDWVTVSSSVSLPAADLSWQDMALPISTPAPIINRQEVNRQQMAGEATKSRC